MLLQDLDLESGKAYPVSVDIAIKGRHVFCFRDPVSNSTQPAP